MYLRVSLTDRCNLRCTYCLPAQARFATQAASSAELRRLVELVHAAVAVHKIRLTGGEPTLCDDLADQVKLAARLVGPAVAMTSNGLLLEPMLGELQEAGLRCLNISLDAVDPQAFRVASRRDGLLKVIAAIRQALALGYAPLKINCVARDDTDYASLVRFAAWEGVHLRFIELMAIGEARFDHARRFVPAGEQRQRLAAAGLYLHQRPDLDQPTSRVYTLEGADPTVCTIGFITTVTQPFCGTCDRLRLSSQGRLHTCLFDEEGHDLLTPLRRGDEMAVVVAARSAIAQKRPPMVSVRHGVMAGIGG